MKKYIWGGVLVVIITLPLILSGCQPVFPYASKWYPEYVLGFNGHEYEVTNQKTNDVGVELGMVVYHGNNPGAFELYAIKNVKDYSRIAVQTRDGYLIVNIGPAIPPLTTP